MLILNNVEVIYDGVILVLKGVSIHCAKGKITTLLGANGAGKTTTLKAVSGLLRSEERGDSAFTHLERHPLEHEDDAVVDDLDVVEAEHRRALTSSRHSP